MSNTTKIIVGIVIVVAIAIALYSIFGKSTLVGSVNCNTNTCLTGGFQADTITSTGALNSDGDSTISGGTLNVTTTNTATSTLVVGCIQMNATSTASPGKISLVSNAGTASTTGANGLFFNVVWTFGTCPNL